MSDNINNSLLANADADSSIQAFKCVQNKLNKVPGDIIKARIIYCVDSGDITVTWKDTTTTTLSMVAGLAFTFDYEVSISIVSGLFHYNTK